MQRRSEHAYRDIPGPCPLVVTGEHLLREATVALGHPAGENATRVGRSRIAGVIPIGRKPVAEFVSWERYGKRT
jgi:hypothetical protein